MVEIANTSVLIFKCRIQNLSILSVLHVNNMTLKFCVAIVKHIFHNCVDNK